MLVIRQAQMDALVKGQQQAIALELGLGFKGEFIAIFQYYSDEQMQVWVTRQLEDLARWQIFEKDNVMAVLTLLAKHGEKFERCKDRSWALELLEKSESNETIRCIKLERASDAYFKQLKLAS